MSSNPSQILFREVQTFDTNYASTTISRYVSERSGMHIVHVSRKSPQVNGYIALATETFDNSGAPDALGNLILKGSESYPYNGLLHKIASRSFSTLNGHIETDHALYTLKSAGWEGFIKTLPIYLNHIFMPKITEETFMTEVYHTNGEGNEGGVLCSDVQSDQYSMDRIMDVEFRRLLYPEDVGFRFGTCDRTEQLRVLTLERIRQFHRDIYHLRNLCLVIDGEMDEKRLFQTLGEFEKSIEEDITSLDKPFARPWIDSRQPPALTESKIATAEFPLEDDTTGEIWVGLFGPNCTETIGSTALSVLLTYLCGSPASILVDALVTREKLASSVAHHVDLRPNSVIKLQLTGVATDKLASVNQRLFELLKDVASRPLEMKYMRQCVGRERLRVKQKAETSESFFAGKIITDYLFGQRDGSTLKDLQNLDSYDVLEKWTDEKWRDFLRKWIADAHRISIFGKPSCEMALKIGRDEEARIAKRNEELGLEGLQMLGKRLEEAKKKNDEPIPPSVIDHWVVPSTDSIRLIDSDTARAGRARALGLGVGKAQKLIDDASPGKLPLFMQFENIDTNFAHIEIHIGTSPVPAKLKPLIPLFCRSFFGMDVKEKEEILSFKHSVERLERDMIDYNMFLSLNNTESIQINLELEHTKYKAVAEWIRKLMFDSNFDPQRLGDIVNKLLPTTHQSKSDGELMVDEVDVALHRDKSTFSAVNRVLVQEAYLQDLKELLEKEPKTVISWFETIRKSLFTFQNLRFLITADLDTLPEPLTTWDTLSQHLVVGEKMVPIPHPMSSLNSEGRNPGSVGAVIVPMAALDTSYSVSSTQGLKSYTDPRLAVLMISIGYLEAPEGPLWNVVRGSGYAYGFNFSYDIYSCILSYYIFASPDANKAISASADAIRKIVDGKVEIDKRRLEDARGQIFAKFVSERSTYFKAAQKNFTQGVIQGLPEGWDEDIMRQLRDVTINQVVETIRDMILPCFKPGKSNISVTCGTLMKDNMENALKKMGYKVQSQELDHFHGDYDLKDDASWIRSLLQP